MEQGTVDTHGLPVRPLPDGSDVRKVTEADVPAVSKAVAAAFYDDPVITWIYPDDSRRLERFERSLEVYVRRIWLPHDACYTTDNLIGGSFWMPPGTAKVSVLRQLSLLPALIATSRGDSGRLWRVLDMLDKKHPHDDPHWYLPLIGIEPDWQGRGFGVALLRPVLERCDAEGTPAYLEASSPRNRALYERHGFEVVDEIAVKDSPPLWPMWRKPATA